MKNSDKTRENRIRRAAAREGKKICKSRAMESVDNYGGYMIVDLYNNSIEAGVRFDMFLEDLEEYFEIKLKE